jgi:rubrerythrin
MKEWASPATKTAEAEDIIPRSRLVKVGGLYRIRDNYESVWKMEAGEDGKSYIVRIGEDGASQRLRVAEADTPEDFPKAANTINAFKTLRNGAVHVVWECKECSTPNITKEGNAYECDECHHAYSDVFGDTSEQGGVLDHAHAVAEYGDWVGARMKREGISKINRNLLEIWAKEDRWKCPNCGDSVKADKCPNCGDPKPSKAYREKHAEHDPPDEPGQKLVGGPAKKCKECGAEMPRSSVYGKCPKCLDKK